LVVELTPWTGPDYPTRLIRIVILCPCILSLRGLEHQWTLRNKSAQTVFLSWRYLDAAVYKGQDFDIENSILPTSVVF
jgi:hypothetical protein